MTSPGGCARRDRLIRLGCFIIQFFMFRTGDKTYIIYVLERSLRHIRLLGGSEVFGEDGWSSH